MKTSRSLAITLLAAVIVVAGSATLGAADITGTWIGQTEIPNQGVDKVTLVIKKTDAGYAGTITDSLGTVAEATELQEIAFTGDDLSFSFLVGDGLSVTVRLKLDGDTLKGKWGHPSGDTGEIALERQKQSF